MSHLGSRLDALVDGELDHDTRDRLLSHVARCPACHQELEWQRGIKAMLRGSSTPLPPADTIVALSSLAQVGAPPPPPSPGPSAPRLVPALAPVARSTDARSGPRAAVMTVGALSIAGLVLGAPLAGGSPTASTSRTGGPTATLTVDSTRPASGTSSGTSSRRSSATGGLAVFQVGGVGMMGLTPSPGPPTAPVGP
jgi:anti-sigma factor RsiW